MKLLEERIQKDGRVLMGNILKVDTFLNHQLDVELFNEMGKELKRLYSEEHITKILTIEVSGIAIAAITAQYFNVPVVFAKKHSGINMDENSFESEVFSYTKKTSYKIRVAKKFIQPKDRILIIDDFLATGSALLGLVELVENAGAKVVGAGIAIEKGFQGGREILENRGIRIESLAIIEQMAEGKINFRHKKHDIKNK